MLHIKSCVFEVRGALPQGPLASFWVKEHSAAPFESGRSHLGHVHQDRPSTSRKSPFSGSKTFITPNSRPSSVVSGAERMEVGCSENFRLDVHTRRDFERAR